MFDSDVQSKTRQLRSGDETEFEHVLLNGMR